jgi:hypothetical protein
MTGGPGRCRPLLSSRRPVSGKKKAVPVQAGDDKLKGTESD